MENATETESVGEPNDNLEGEITVIYNNVTSNVWPYAPISPESASFELLLGITGVELALFIISLISCPFLVASISCHCAASPAKLLYFHLAALFAISNLIYFTGSAVIWTTISLDSLGEFELPEEMLSERFLNFSSDFLTCVFGTGLLLLSSMTLDCLASHSVRSISLRKCLDIFNATSSVLLGICAFFAVRLLRDSGNQDCYLSFLYADVDLGLDYGERQIIAAFILICLFGLLPIVVTFMVGVCNCVTDSASSRPISRSRRAARSLDCRACAVAIPLMLAFIVERAVRLSLYLSEQDAEWELALVALMLLKDLLFALVPVIFSCVLGSFCFCCYKV